MGMNATKSNLKLINCLFIVPRKVVVVPLIAPSIIKWFLLFLHYYNNPIVIKRFFYYLYFIYSSHLFLHSFVMSHFKNMHYSKCIDSNVASGPYLV